VLIFWVFAPGYEAAPLSGIAGKLGNIVSTTKMFLNLLENTFASREANFVSAQQRFSGWANWETLT
jgi:hypothetical protein